MTKFEIIYYNPINHFAIGWTNDYEDDYSCRIFGIHLGFIHLNWTWKEEDE